MTMSGDGQEGVAVFRFSNGVMSGGGLVESDKDDMMTSNVIMPASRLGTKRLFEKWRVSNALLTNPAFLVETPKNGPKTGPFTCIEIFQERRLSSAAKRPLKSSFAGPSPTPSVNPSPQRLYLLLPSPCPTSLAHRHPTHTTPTQP